MEHAKHKLQDLNTFENEGGLIGTEVKDSRKSRTWLNKEGVKSISDKFSRCSKDAFRNCSRFYTDKKSLIQHYSLVLAAVLFVIFLFQNIESSQVEFLFWGFAAPKIVLFFAMLGIGSVFGYWLHGRNVFNSRSPQTEGESPIEP